MRWRPSPAFSTSRRHPTASGNGLPPEEKPAAPPIEAHGYSKVGPGPMAAIRFKWTVREDNGDYYVDETIGENSARSSADR